MTQATELSGPRYWKSLDDLAGTPAFREWMEREFPGGASELDGVNRRHFMKIMAASFGFAGLGMAGCRRPEQRILPYSQQPENLIPGVPVFYCSSVPGARDNLPVIVETHQARPTKIEGNPSYRPYGGATDVYTQASILDLYDPDRMTKSRADGAVVDAAAVRDQLSAIGAGHATDGGRGLVFLAEPSTSPSRARLAEAIQAKFPLALWAEYSPVDHDAPVRGIERVTGKRLRPLPQMEKAKRILAIDADFVQHAEGKLGHARGFAEGRAVQNAGEAHGMSRLYAVESNLTLTGAMADHRLRLEASRMGAFVALVGRAILEKKGVSGPLLEFFKVAGDGFKADPKWVGECAADLVEHGRDALILAGEHLPEAIHGAVFALNAVLGADGRTVRYVEAPAPAAGIAEAGARLAAGQVKSLVILGGNPVYDAPADLEWKTLQAQAARTFHLSYHPNETTAAAAVQVARSHYLESWGDGRTVDGTLVPVQPMIEPLFPAFNELEVLARIAGLDTIEPHAIARATFEELAGSGASYGRFLSEGLLAGSAFAPVRAAADPAGLDAAVFSPAVMEEGEVEVLFTPSAHAYDGRYANNGWLMECPDPLTKLTWDNAILISPRLAKELEAESGIPILGPQSILTKQGALQANSAEFERGKQIAPVAELTVNGRTLKGPVHVLPGLANRTVVLPLGFGRETVGRVGRGAGFNAYAVRTGDGLGLARGAALKLISETYRLANTQEHWSMEGRAILRESDVEDYVKHPDFVDTMGVEAHSPPIYGKAADESLQYKVTKQPRGNSAYETPTFTEPAPNVKIWQREGAREKFPEIQQWGMTIDLNRCTSCNACVVACQSENNIPIVGKDQVLRGREMHWIRLDRYFSSAENDSTEVPEDVQVSFMGMACQHCENAPCESVCPVNATVHDEQGLNVMAYNRCVGTRYCANNCPYKVRRFNFFDWNKRAVGDFYKGPLAPVDEPELEKMRANPDVTVRMRGVMEKCTYCVQRIQSARIDQLRRAGASGDVKVPDGRIQTACQQVCPADAIVFGDVSDPESEVSRLKESDRDYSVLGYLNIRPRTTYLARVRNPNPKMPGPVTPFTRQAYEDRYGHGGGHGPHHGNGAGGHGDAAAHEETTAH